MQNTPELVVYRKEQLPEFVSAVILNHRLGAEIENIPAKVNLPVQKAEGKNVVVYGSYHKDDAMKELSASAKHVTVHMYKVDSAGRYEKLTPEELEIALVDSKTHSYAGYTWDRYLTEEAPRVLQLLDLKGRSQYDQDPAVKPFIEWLYVTGVSFERLRDLLFTDNYDLEDCIRIGSYYQKKSESLVGSISDAAGWYTMFEGKHRVAIVDATKPIELLGEELCKRGADCAVIARYDHETQLYRYSLYTCNPNIIAVHVTKGAGYDAGGSEKISGFLTTQSVGEFIKANKVIS